MTPTSAPSACSTPGCGRTTTSGRCPECRGEAEVRRGSARSRGYTARWEKIRLRQLADEPFCRYCGPGFSAKEVDHVIPHRGRRWLFDLEENLQSLCSSCHWKKSGEEQHRPIGLLYPTDLPTARPRFHIIAGPRAAIVPLQNGYLVDLLRYEENVEDLSRRNAAIARAFELEASSTVVLRTWSPRSAERAFWRVLSGADAVEVLDGQSGKISDSDWWRLYERDLHAEAEIERRRGGL